MFYFRDLMNFLYSRTFSECFVDQEITLAGRSDQLFQQVFLRARIKILRMTQTVIAILQASDCLLECFFEILTDTARICVPSLSSTPLNFSNAQRANLITT